jgi:hypothetical protein
MGSDMSQIFQAIDALLQADTGFFVGMGRNLFTGLATIMIVWFGIKSALSSGSREGGFQFSNFASLIMVIAFGEAMVTYYATPIPGIGRSFHSLVTDEAHFLSQQILQAQLDTLMQQITDFSRIIPTPSIADLTATVLYAVSVILVAAAQAIALVVIAYGFIAQAVCVLVGPVFIPFFVVPKLDWLFWGWFKAFLQFSFYQVVASAVVYIIGNVLTAFLRAHTAPGVSLLALFPSLFIVFLGSIYALLKIPSLTNAIFSGSSGGSSGFILGGRLIP